MNVEPMNIADNNEYNSKAFKGLSLSNNSYSDIVLKIVHLKVVIFPILNLTNANLSSVYLTIRTSVTSQLITPDL